MCIVFKMFPSFVWCFVRCRDCRFQVGNLSSDIKSESHWKCWQGTRCSIQVFSYFRLATLLIINKTAGKIEYSKIDPIPKYAVTYSVISLSWFFLGANHPIQGHLQTCHWNGLSSSSPLKGQVTWMARLKKLWLKNGWTQAFWVQPGILRQTSII